MVDSHYARAPLGHDVSYPDAYDPHLLFPIARSANRQKLPRQYEWFGADIWNAYEVSWLNLRGKPLVGTARFVFSHASPNLIESKSLKLYLNSFNEDRFDCIETVRKRIEHDLSRSAGDPVAVTIDTSRSRKDALAQPLAGTCLDDADISIDTYHPAPQLLRCLPQALVVNETLVSDLLKSNCPVTGQPDWASVQIQYTGQQMDHAALLQYVVSLRRHDGFHEHCVEQIYSDLWEACQPEFLLVYARYTRRGGLDINPWRSSRPAEVSQTRTVRQ